MRENGGQYTHGSVWLAIANMMLKNRSTAYQLLSMLNPINKTFTPEGVKKYVREPYVLSADISAAPNYMGQGGWSWYTGSASWMYRAIVNWFLGIRREGRRLLIDPAVPTQFGSFLVQYRYESSVYSIKVNVSEMVRASLQRLVVDDVPMEGNSFLLVDDGKEHHVVFHLMCSYTIDPGDITDKHKNERSTSRDADYIRIT
jgi:cellobiose phosphorylase